MKRMLVLGAMGLELKALTAALASPERDDSPLPCTRGRIGNNEVVLYRCGVGSGSRAAAIEALEAFGPDFALNAGTAGGLSEGLRKGAVIACPSVVSDFAQGELRPDPSLLQAALGAGAARGACLTVRLPLVTPEEKREAARGTGCAICEMEAWHVASAAGAVGVPFLTLKAVSESVKDRLPDLRRLMDGAGAAKPAEVALYLAARPDEAARAARFVRSASAVMKGLARVLAFAGSL